MVSIVLAQLNFTVGNLEQNAQKMLDAMKKVTTDIIVFPELALTGYPPEDLLLRDDFIKATQKALHHIQTNMPENLIAIIGYPDGKHNAAAVLSREKIIATHHKQILPNYGVFDEKRYFTEGKLATVFEHKNKKIGVTICEDLWHSEPAQEAKKAGAELLISINASPFHANKTERRIAKMRERVSETGLPIYYVNHCGAQDDLIFDGGSFVLDKDGKIIAQAELFKETILITSLAEIPSRESQIYQALVLGVKDYVHKNKFTKAILGFSGGIDSALTLAVAVDALGKENVLPIILPSRYTSSLSLEAAQKQLHQMNLHHEEISIEPLYESFLSTLGIEEEGLTTQNLQARIRGTILMACSNQSGAILLNTSNKSEIAAGYGTLYGDLCGGYAVLKDVWKTDVYKLAHYRNTVSPVIPTEIIERDPTAELAPNQLDTDNLPPYEILDEILKKYVEYDLSIEEIVKLGFNHDTVKKLVKLLNLNEFKRRQVAPGPRVSRRAFTRERRYPITNDF